MPTQRKSKKRDAIYALLQSTKGHPSAEWIYTQLKDEIPDLSLGTVYRNLARFREENQAVCVATVNGQDRFDACTAPHAHFVCKCCGAVADIEGITIPSLDEGQYGTFQDAQLTYYGICRDCEKSATA